MLLKVISNICLSMSVKVNLMNFGDFSIKLIPKGIFH